MVLDGLYLAVNVAVLVLLARWKYYREFPLFVAFQGFACLEIASRLPVPGGLAGEHTATYVWFPCAILLMVGSVGAAMELLWKAMHAMPREYKMAVVAGVGVVLYSFPPVLRIKLHLPSYSNWFEDFVRADLTVFYLCVMMLVATTFGIICTVKLIRQACPRYVRFHGLLLTILLACFVYLTDFSTWHRSRELWMAVKFGMCCGFIANASLLRFQARLSGLPGWGGPDLRAAVSYAPSSLLGHLRAVQFAIRSAQYGPDRREASRSTPSPHHPVSAVGRR